ncbi:MAG: histone deacetylase, partial [Flavobacteriales bacterium]
HSFSDRGEGFCLLNDFAITAQVLLSRGKAKKVMIVDLDVHQGNGTAKIFENNNNVFTFSMHGGKNYPLQKEKSDLDVPLEDGIEDEEYLSKLQFHLPKILDSFQPDFVLYQCGVDILSSDKLGRLGVSLDGCKQRDRIVFSEVKERAIPIACAMGGGYSEEIKYIVEAHANTFRLADELFGD